MLTSCQDVWAYSEIFSEGGTNFRHFFKRIFSTELILSNFSTKTTLGGSGGMLSRKSFESLHIEMAILVLFEKILRKVRHIFGP